MSLTLFCGFHICLCISLKQSTSETFLLILYFSNINYLWTTTWIGREHGKPEAFLSFRMNMMGWSLKRWLLHWYPCIAWSVCKDPPQNLTCWSAGDPLQDQTGWSTQLGQAGIPVQVLQPPPPTHCCIPSGGCIQHGWKSQPWSPELSYSHRITTWTRRRKYHDSLWLKAFCVDRK